MSKLKVQEAAMKEGYIKMTYVTVLGIDGDDYLLVDYVLPILIVKKFTNKSSNDGT